MSTPPPMNLPATLSLSPAVITFLNTTFLPTHDRELAESTHLVTDLDTRSSQLSHQLSDLTRHLELILLSYSSSSDRIGGAFHHVRRQLDDLRSISSSFASSSDGNGEQLVAEELSALAKEVARVELVRNYAETALKLDSLVGEIEDAVSSMMSKRSITQGSEERMSAIGSLKLTEDVLSSVMSDHPQWVRLVSAADHRVDRALAILRPQAIADHRTLLASLGWPPPLATLNSLSFDTRRDSEVLNPLLSMNGETKKKYCSNFLALCSLQELQRRRKLRQLEGYKRDIAQYQPLWGIEELANPLCLASYPHFQRFDKPEFIFALVYKITRDYIDSVDELLQPLVDEAMLTGYSCREEWISAMATSLSTYLAKEIFPAYISRLNEVSLVDVRLQTKMSWLDLIDLMISFDKRVQSLATHSVIKDSSEYSLLPRMSTLSVFCDRPDWLDIWAEIELGSILDQLKPEMEDDRNWARAVIPGSEDYKSPTISFIFLDHVKSVIDRCRSLPAVFLRSRFIRLVGASVINTLLDCLLTKCLEAEGLTALADDDALALVVTSVNSARHLELVLKLRSEDEFFLEMGLEHDEESSKPFNESGFADVSDGLISGPFEEEIRKLEEFRKQWVDKTINVVLRGFDAYIREYFKNKKQWQEKAGEGGTVTQSFVVALDYLKGKMCKLEEFLNDEDFIVVWKSIASGVDRLIFNGIFMSNAKFHGGGVERFGGDMNVLFGVFRSWCLRPEGFFCRVSEGLKLLKMEENQLQDLFVQGDGWMKHHRIKQLNLAEAERIARCRVFMH